MISPDDPRLTAHADGALPPEEAARFERELAADPAARAELERLRLLQRELREAFAEETAEAEAPFATRAPAAPALALAPDLERPGTEADSAPSSSARELLFSDWWPTLLAAACIVFVAVAIITPPRAQVRESSRRALDASNLRQIGQATLIAAGDHRNHIPAATDVWGHARQLAIYGGLNDGIFWTAGGDPASASFQGVSTVVGPDRKTLETAFARSKPAWAVLLGEIDLTSLPSTTPIAWTRGLQPDGTWATHSPYGRQGGHVVFLGGNVRFFREIAEQLHRHDGGGMTSNILEALPPGARVGEYVPSAEEARAWALVARPELRSGRRPFPSWPFYLVSVAGVLGALTFWLRGRLSTLGFLASVCLFALLGFLAFVAQISG